LPQDVMKYYCSIFGQKLFKTFSEQKDLVFS